MTPLDSMGEFYAKLALRTNLRHNLVMESTISVNAVRRDAVKRLQSHSESAQIDVDTLLCQVLEKDRSWLIAYSDTILTLPQKQRMDHLLKRRLKGEPIAYITGVKEFWSLNIEVNPSVLIPRAATETLVEHCLALIPNDEDYRVLELGTGSGAIAIALASEKPNAHIIASDIDPSALLVAKQNATSHGLANIEFVLSNWYQEIEQEPFDLIVSNPPYIEEGAPDLASDVSEYEPNLALYSLNQGLDAIDAISAGARNYLKNGGHLLVEHGWKQREEVERVMLNTGLTVLGCKQDLAGLDRVTLAMNK